MRFEAAVNSALAGAQFAPGEGLNGPEKVALLVEFAFLVPLPPEADPQLLEKRFGRLRAECLGKAKEARALLERKSG
jgi:hypothetical protein